MTCNKLKYLNKEFLVIKPPLLDDLLRILIFIFLPVMFLFLMTEGVDVAVFISRGDGDLALPGELHHLLVVPVALHAELLGDPAHLLRYLLPHEVHAHRDEGHPYQQSECQSVRFYKMIYDQCGPLSLVEIQRGLALIGRELHSVAPPVSLMP